MALSHRGPPDAVVLCHARPGTPCAQVQAQAARRGYRLHSYDHSRRTIIEDSDTLGLFVCVVSFDPHGLTTAHYLFN
ncbi:MAG: hypothetical protein ACYDEV_10665 [Acidiferrobacter sp.]